MFVQIVTKQHSKNRELLEKVDIQDTNIREYPRERPVLIYQIHTKNTRVQPWT